RARTSTAWSTSSAARACSTSLAKARERHGVALGVLHDRLRIALRRSAAHLPRLVYDPVRQTFQLGDPAPHVGAVRIEALTLAHGIEHTEVRLRVRAGGRGPLPVAVVRGEIAVDQALEEDALALAPVDAELLREEARGHHARAVVHPAG